MQVADRFHLVHNLQDALKRLLERQWRLIRDVARLTPAADLPPVTMATTGAVGKEAAPEEAQAPARPTVRQQRSQNARDRRAAVIE